MSNKDNLKTIKQLRTELQDILAWFEGEDFSLDEASSKYKTAETIATRINEQLDKHENTITALKKRFDG